MLKRLLFALVACAATAADAQVLKIAGALW